METDHFRSPVASLLDDIKYTLNYVTEGLSESRKEAIINLKINIKLDYQPGQLQTPVTILETKTIKINETYLSYLWTCCYAVIGLNDIYYKKAKLNQLIVTFGDVPEYKLIMQTLSWGRSLRNEHSLWPSDIPNPLWKDDTATNANTLLTTVILFQTLHEIGHLILHSDIAEFILLAKSQLYDKTPEDKRRLYNAEVQADDYAFDCIKTSGGNPDQMFIKYLGAVISLLTSFYLLDTADTRQGTHPDLDSRLRSVIRKLDLVDESHQIHMKAICSLGIQLFMALTGAPFEPFELENPDFKTFEELHNFLFAIIDKMKEDANKINRR